MQLAMFRFGVMVTLGALTAQAVASANPNFKETGQAASEATTSG